MSTDGKSDLNNFCGMWKKTSGKGTDYLTSVLTEEKHGEILRQLLKDLSEGAVNLMAFRVANKKTDRSPDWSLSYSKIVAQKPVTPASAPQPTTASGAVDDIPF